MVSSQIISRLYDAELVIADLSFHNANAFYEMAIRHNVGKPIIHMIRKNESIPFDVIPHRAIPFSVEQSRFLEEAREALRPAILQAIQPGFAPDNPITHALGQVQLQKNASPEMKVITEEMAALRGMVVQLSAQVAQQSNLATSLARIDRRVKAESLSDLFKQMGEDTKRRNFNSLADLGKLIQEDE